MTKDEARRIVANIAQLPELVKLIRRRRRAQQQVSPEKRQTGLWPPRWRPSSFRCGATAKAHRIAANIAKLRGCCAASRVAV
jgi:hypothetical protein